MDNLESSPMLAGVHPAAMSLNKMLNIQLITPSEEMRGKNFASENNKSILISDYCFIL